MKRALDLIGKRFGMLTVVAPAEPSPSGSRRWMCQCDCGNITYKTTGHLNANAVSCGCLQKKDLTGKRFGALIVLGKSEKRKGRSVLWRCQCDCGNICEKPTNELNSGFATSCGCRWNQPAVCEGERYGRLVAIRPTEQRGGNSVMWECQCDCGNTLLVRATGLKSGHTTSCGCAKREIDDQRDFKTILTYVDDTCIEFAKNIGKPRSTTSADTGVRGVRLVKGKYQAEIVFKKKRYNLGLYSKLDDAIAARKRAEGLVKEYVDEYLSGNPSPEINLE